MTPTGNPHMGIFNAANARRHPDSEDDSIERILDEATSRGATLLWKDHFWAECNGVNAAFLDL